MGPAGSTNIVRQGQASPSALRVAVLRAAHSLLDEPLVLDDPLALPILGPALAAKLIADPFVHNEPMARTLRASLILRARFVEDELAALVAAGVRQYVVLGAGLDTFACRNPHAPQGLTVFEVDHPATQGWKRQLLAGADIAVPSDLRFVAVDFEQDALLPALVAAGFAADQPALVSWLGVTMYLSREAIDATLRPLAGLATGSTVIFDFMPVPEHMHPVERAAVDHIRQEMAARGEPWLSLFDPAALTGQLSDLGFSTAEIFEPPALNRRYLDRRKDGLRSSLRLARAVV